MKSFCREKLLFCTLISSLLLADDCLLAIEVEKFSCILEIFGPSGESLCKEVGTNFKPTNHQRICEVREGRSYLSCKAKGKDCRSRLHLDDEDYQKQSLHIEKNDSDIDCEVVCSGSPCRIFLRLSVVSSIVTTEFSNSSKRYTTTGAITISSKTKTTDAGKYREGLITNQSNKKYSGITSSRSSSMANAEVSTGIPNLVSSDLVTSNITVLCIAGVCIVFCSFLAGNARYILSKCRVRIRPNEQVERRVHNGSVYPSEAEFQFAKLGTDNHQTTQLWATPDNVIINLESKGSRSSYERKIATDRTRFTQPLPPLPRKISYERKLSSSDGCWYDKKSHFNTSHVGMERCSSEDALNGEDQNNIWKRSCAPNARHPYSRMSSYASADGHNPSSRYRLESDFTFGRDRFFSNLMKPTPFCQPGKQQVGCKNFNQQPLSPLPTKLLYGRTLSSSDGCWYDKTSHFYSSDIRMETRSSDDALNGMNQTNIWKRSCTANARQPYNRMSSYASTDGHNPSARCRLESEFTFGRDRLLSKLMKSTSTRPPGNQKVNCTKQQPLSPIQRQISYERTLSSSDPCWYDKESHFNTSEVKKEIFGNEEIYQNSISKTSHFNPRQSYDRLSSQFSFDGHNSLPRCRLQSTFTFGRDRFFSNLFRSKQVSPPGRDRSGSKLSGSNGNKFRNTLQRQSLHRSRYMKNSIHRRKGSRRIPSDWRFSTHQLTQCFSLLSLNMAEDVFSNEHIYESISVDDLRSFGDDENDLILGSRHCAKSMSFEETTSIYSEPKLAWSNGATIVNENCTKHEGVDLTNDYEKVKQFPPPIYIPVDQFRQHMKRCSLPSPSEMVVQGVEEILSPDVNGNRLSLIMSNGFRSEGNIPMTVDQVKFFEVD